MNTTLFAIISAFAANNPEGFTFNLNSMKAQETGYAVARVETQNSFGPEGLESVINFCAGHPEVTCIGGWYDSKSGQFYYDATMIIKDREEAIMLGRANDQLAIFDLDTLTEIRLK